MGRPCRVVVLVEDARQQRFVRRYLKRLGYREHDIRLEALPGGRGSGEQWVREQFANAVGACRARSWRAETALVVAIDADNSDLNRRLYQLQHALTQAGLAPRTPGERIAHLIPKRSIETWILNLNGRDVDEDTDYSREHGIDEQITTAATNFFDWSRPNQAPPGHCVPSLRSAIDEIRRLE